jgi:hypothetical protein
MARHVLILVVYKPSWVRIGGLASIQGRCFEKDGDSWKVGADVPFPLEKANRLCVGVYIFHYTPNPGISCGIAGMAEAIVIDDAKDDVWPLPPASPLHAPQTLAVPLDLDQASDPWPTPPPQIQIDGFQKPLKRYVLDLLLQEF